MGAIYEIRQSNESFAFSAQGRFSDSGRERGWEVSLLK